MRLRSLRTTAGLLLVLLQLCAHAGSTAEARDAAIRFVHRERSLQPGEVVLLKAGCSRPMSRITAEAFGREFPLFTEDGGLNWIGLLGIDLETRPGSYAVILNGIDGAGAAVSVRDVLAVAAKRFPTRKLTVEDKYVDPPGDVLTRIREERERVSAIFAAVTREKFWQGSFLLPVPGEVISAFGKRSVYNGQPRSPHSGVDFRAAAGTPVRAPNAGKVVLAADLYYSGKTVIVDHGLGLYSYFGHMSAFSVKEGDHVKAGDVLGKVGATGLATGPHLHWTVRLAGTRVDPLSLVHILGNSADSAEFRRDRKRTLAVKMPAWP